MEVGLVRKIDIDVEMQQAYLDYAMSVIVARALPDARDGLKPVHRRILYAMYDMGLRTESTYKKSARIVGEVLGKYHPHGDMAVYDAMARMAQDFSMRCPMVDGQGNFGSVDGDPPAAMRYTEARLTSPALDMLADIGKETVDFDVNFDDTLTEPSVLPAAVPNLLVNGATGIAVGMSTSIPPHNLDEVVDALKYMLEKWRGLDNINVEDLMQFIKGPDFPTGGLIIQDRGEDVLTSAYGSGRGRITVRARAHLEEMGRGRNRIIVTELPYMTNKSSLIERIASLAREERLEGLADLRDESDRQGMRIVIELTKTADPEEILRRLYKYTPMQTTFSIILLALVDGEPRMLSLKQALRVYLDHRLEIVRRGSEYELKKARQRAHILEGLRVAIKNLDAVIALIRKAADVPTARTRLRRRYKLSEAQAQAILEMQLRRLAALERKKIEQEYKEVQKQIKELEALLRSPLKMRRMVAAELDRVKEAYGDRRRTQIVSLKEGEPKKSLLTARDLLPEKIVWLSVTADGLISRSLEDKMPRQSGNEAPAWLLRVNTRHTLFLVNKDGQAAALSMHGIPEAEKPLDGVPISRVSALKEDDKLAVLLSLPPKIERAEGWYVLTATRQGMVKKSALSDLPGPSADMFTLVRVNEGDELGWVRLTDGKPDVLLATASGMAIRFSGEDVRPMGLVAAGVMGIKLRAGNEVVGMETLPDKGEVFLVASNGLAKRVAVGQFPKQGRYGQGVVAWKPPAKVSAVGMTVGKGTMKVTLHLKKLAPKMTRLDAAPLQGRTARGKVIQELKAGDEITGMTVPWDLVAGMPKGSPVKKKGRGKAKAKK
ncbi:MAG: DNA gyrase subunit A [Anaerolineales bacterium]|nr:DNA gyrase subunit A [Anaerolineales bacterium]